MRGILRTARRIPIPSDAATRDVTMPMKPGYKTTELWLSLAVIAAATVALVAGALDQQTWSATVAAATAGYSISRGLAKRP